MNPYEWLKNRLLENGSITTWYWNDDVMLFTDKFYPDKRHKYVARKMSYYMRKLVKEGVSRPSVKMGLGESGMNDFGARFQTIWEKRK